MLYCKEMLGGLNLTTIIVIIVTLLISMTIHEFMHAFVAYKLGDDTAMEGGRLTFNPLAHIDPVMTVLLPAVTLILFGAPILAAKPVPFNPARVKYDEYGAAMIALAGPVSNLLLAVIGAFIAVALGGQTTFAGQVMEVFTQLNVALFVFNIIPIPPLDGSRVLYAFAPPRLQELMERIEPVGLFIIFALVLLPGGLGTALVNLNQLVLNLLPA